ncbi:thiol-disulfide oxidoreductase DCC family protein, partial [Acinetobacter soli]
MNWTLASQKLQSPSNNTIAGINIASFTPSLQGEAGKALRTRHRIPEAIHSIVLLKDGVPYLKSDAAIRIAEGLDGGWRWLGLIRIVSRPLRDFGYDVIAKNRYKWFGMK